MMQSMQAIRKLVSAKASTSVNCLVLYNVCMKRTESTSHPFECKLRLGWGVANLTTAYQSIAKFATKTTTHTEDHDNHASDSARPSVESQTCALALQADEPVESRESHETSALGLQADEPDESHASGSVAREAEVVVETSEPCTNTPEASNHIFAEHEPTPKRQRLNDVSINSSEDVTCLQSLCHIYLLC